MRSLTLVIGLAMAGFLIGCGSSARVVAENQRITTVGDVDVQDWNNASAQMAEALAASPALTRLPRQPALLEVSRVINNTSMHLDTDMLTFNLCTALRDTGKIVPRTRDEKAGEYAKANQFKNDATFEQRMSDFTLSGKIMEDTARADRLRQSTFTFQLVLNDTRSGTEVWSKQVQITKQGTKPAVGF